MPLRKAARVFAGLAILFGLYVLVFVVIAVVRVPLLWALAAIAPASVAFAWWAQRR